MYCINSVAPCTGCGECTGTDTQCFICHRPIFSGEEYVDLMGKAVCKDCITVYKDSAVCSYCGEETKNTFEAMSLTLCPVCADRNTYIV